MAITSTDLIKIENAAEGEPDHILLLNVNDDNDDGDTNGTDPETGEPIPIPDNSPLDIESRDPDTRDPIYDDDLKPLYLHYGDKDGNFQAAEIKLSWTPADALRVWHTPYKGRFRTSGGTWYSKPGGANPTTPLSETQIINADTEGNFAYIPNGATNHRFHPDNPVYVELLSSPSLTAPTEEPLALAAPLPGLPPETSPAEDDIKLKLEVGGQSYSIAVVTVQIIPDYNRDGKIDDSDRGKISQENPWRWWINYDDDQVNTPRGNNLQDNPTQGLDLKDDKVDGIRDLLDFFPLHFDIGTLVELLPPTEFKYLIKHEDGAINFFEVPEVIIDDNESGEGPNRNILNVPRAEAVQNAQLTKATVAGAQLSTEILSAFQAGKGALYIEAIEYTNKPIVLEIQKNDGTKLAEFPFYVKFVDVENMYRHVNLRFFTDGAGGHATQTDEPPSYPDNLTNGKYVSYTHGYNVSGESAQGSQSNIFKRLHQLGNKARYIGITWNGNPPNPGINLGNIRS